MSRIMRVSWILMPGNCAVPTVIGSARRCKSGNSTWTFKDSAGLQSRLRIKSAGEGRFVGGWARGATAAILRDARAVDAVFDSIAFESPAAWPEERFASLVARVPRAWTRGSRFSNPTNATMQFKTPPLAVETGSATIHGFVTLAKEPVPAPGDLPAFSKMLRDRASDTVAVLNHQTWSAPAADTPAGYVDYLRTGNTLTSSRLRRWIAVKNGVGLVFSCESRADVFDRLDPWCRRAAATVRLE